MSRSLTLLASAYPRGTNGLSGPSPAGSRVIIVSTALPSPTVTRVSPVTGGGVFIVPNAQ